MSKKAFVLLMVLMLILSMLPVCASAAVYVNGLEVSGDYTITENNAVITGDGQRTSVSLTVAPSVSALTLGGGVNIRVSGKAAMLVQGNLALTLEGENRLEVSGWDHAALEQKGVSVSASSTTGVVTARGSLLTIQGDGKLTAIGGDYGAGIGGAEQDGSRHANIEILSGEIHAVGGSNSPGIGSGRDGTALIKISGGKITAQGGKYGAGIGSGACTSLTKSNYADVTISGGEVSATGGECGAGVGGGDYGAQAKVNISGGKVTAQGGAYAAGVGNGMSYHNTRVQISGGTVHATGGDGAGASIGGSGIGGGRGFSYTPKALVQVEIMGGMINAAGGANNGVSIGGDGVGDGVKLRFNSSEPISAETGTDGQTYTALSGSPFTTSTWMNITDWTDRYFRSCIPVTISFAANGGTGSMESVAANKDSEYMLPACRFTAPANKVFASWDVNGKMYDAGDVITVTGNTTVKACWREMVQYTLSFDANGGTGSMSAMNGYEGDRVTIPACDFSRKGYTFAGWQIAQTVYQPGDAYELKGHVTAAAQWTANAHTITYTDGNEEVKIPAHYGDVHTLEQNSFAVPQGKEFDCWLIEGVRCNPGDTVDVMGDITVAAAWKNMPVITFSAGGAQGTMAQVVVAVGSSYVLPECGFTGTGSAQFIGWDVSGMRCMPGDTITVTQDMTVTALWEMEEQREIVSADLEDMDASDLPQDLQDALGGSGNIIEVIVEKMEAGLSEQNANTQQIEHYDVQLMISNDDGKTWKPATEDDFGKDGIEVVLPYPAGTNGEDYEFTVAHMFGHDSEKLGTKAGEIEYPAVTNRADGLAFKVKGLSPVSVAWRLKNEAQAAEELPQTGDPSHLLAWAMLLGVSLKLRRKMK